MPYILKVAQGKLPHLNVFGNDYPTPDGTGVRDYIHVTDLALGHVAAVNYVNANVGVGIFNLGTGNGYSVLDVVNAFNQASGSTLPYVIAPRRPGDIATCYACPDKALAELGWKAERDLAVMCRDSWNAVQKNPDGYPND
jgi:UDP-glucose 4-epimerase